MFDFLETFSSLRDVSATSPRRLLKITESPKSRKKFKHVRFFWRLFPVSETSPSVAATSRRLIISATAETSPRRLRNLAETQCKLPAKSPRLPGNVSETSPRLPETSRRLVATKKRLGDVAATTWKLCSNIPATAEQSACHLVWRSRRDVSLVRAQAIFLLETSPRLPRLISWRRRGDVSVGEIRPLIIIMSICLNNLAMQSKS